MHAPTKTNTGNQASAMLMG